MESVSSDAEMIWQIALERLHQRNIHLYVQWFQKMIPLAVAGQTLRLGVSDEFFGDLVKEYYDDFLLEALTDIRGVTYRYEFEPGYDFTASARPAAAPASEPAAAPARTSAVTPPEPVSRPAHPPAAGSAAHTFANFVVGAENRIAFEAAKVAAESPGRYNPLYLYGASGVGKTHLLQAITASLKQNSPQLVIRYAPCDELITDFYNLLQQKRSLTDFRASVRNVDVLLVDDVHSLANKKQMQEEFFNLFNTLYNNGKQIVFTSDRQPCEIQDLDKRLVTRFESGMTADIGAPEYEARLAILRMMRDELLDSSHLNDECLDFLAANISSSVRRLKGAFYRLSSYASLNGTGSLTIEMIEDQLHAILAEEHRQHNVTIEEIQRSVAEHFGITLSALLGKERTRSVAEPRMVAMFLCRELTKSSSVEIGAAFGKTHAAILHAESKVAELCRDDEMMKHSVARLRRALEYK